MSQSHATTGYEAFFDPRATDPALISMFQHLFVDTEEYIMVFHSFGTTKLVFTNLRIVLLEESNGEINHRFVLYGSVISFSVCMKKYIQMGTLEILLSSGEHIHLSSNRVRDVLSAQQSLAKYVIKGPSYYRSSPTNR